MPNLKHDSSEDLLAAGKGPKIRVKKQFASSARLAVRFLQDPNAARLVERCETVYSGDWDQMRDAYRLDIQLEGNESVQAELSTDYRRIELLRDLERNWSGYGVRIGSKPCSTLYDFLEYFPSESGRYDGGCLDEAVKAFDTTKVRRTG